MKFNLKKTALIGASAAAVLFAAVAVAQDAPRFGKGFGKHHSPFSQEAREKWCSPKRVTLINVFEVPKGSEEAAIQSWEKSRDFLARQKGYISTKLHRAIRPDGTASNWLTLPNGHRPKNSKPPRKKCAASCPTPCHKAPCSTLVCTTWYAATANRRLPKNSAKAKNTADNAPLEKAA
ncbi:antibiotic biosynthesis monooxygenase family protein [Kingella potus]|uniref:antibiotic biosynthesis monooxygenase family protein n=1 Tax=Kingella potus TaxID=265175 RepID=UPI001FD30EE5|nr:antibiotic biosynthesis monooxygenase [Kingella potus]UOP00327.1 antibiotic biosynthesis monooxygenase [Kingella potus]